MNRRDIAPGIYWAGSIDWDRRLFDALIPLPDGTSYNSYVVETEGPTVLVDTSDPRFEAEYMAGLDGIANIGYIIAHHVEQDHSGVMPRVLQTFPNAKVICTPKGQGLFIDHLHISPDRFITVEDGQTIEIGGRVFRFIHTPWVHWPETMCTYMEHESILFSCDFFGSHLATSDLFVTDEARVYEAAKRYFAEIMMPFRATIQKNLEKVESLKATMIAPSHGPVYNNPEFIIDAYRDWALSPPKNLAVVPWVTMHGSTEFLVARLVEGLVNAGVRVERYNLTVTDLGKLATSLVDAATVVLGTPTVLAGPHPNAVHAAFLLNALRPKVKHVSVIGSYGWAGKTVETIAGLISGLRAEVLEPVMCKGFPREENLRGIDRLVQDIVSRHKDLGLMG